MKVSTGNLRRPKFTIVPPIPFHRPDPPKPDKSDQLTFKLRSNPGNADSATYELTVAYFRTGTPEEWLLVRKAILEICTGQNLTTGPQRFILARRVLKGDALAAFNDQASEEGNETLATFNTCLRHVTDHVFPARALQTQKRYMRRMMYKPRDVTIRKYAARLAEINAYLIDFPPHGDDQQLPVEELLEILEFAVPAEWQKQMIRHGINPADQTIAQFVQFCERLESTEPAQPEKRARESDTDNTSGRRGKRARNGGAKSSSDSNSTASKDCIKCGKNAGHTTDNCWELREQLGLPLSASQKAILKKKRAGKKKKSYSDEEINTIVNKKVQQALKIRDTKTEAADTISESSVNMEEFNFDPEKDASDVSDME